MPTVYKPNQRRGNASWIVRGWANGNQHEIAVEGATNKKTALRGWNAFVLRTEKARTRQAQALSFSDGLDRYTVAMQPSKQERLFHSKLRSYFGKVDLAGITAHDVIEAAQNLYPQAKNSTKNRQVVTPMSAVLNWCADVSDGKWRQNIRIKSFKEAKPVHRRPATNVEQILLDNTTGDKHLLFAILFGQGFRITETLGIEWDNIDMDRQTIILYVGKAKEEKIIPIEDYAFSLLKKRKVRTGRLFNWTNRQSVYGWLNPLKKELGIRFTPHMARHEFASARNEVGSTPSDLKEASSWTTIQSIERYTEVDLKQAKKTVNRAKQGGN